MRDIWDGFYDVASAVGIVISGVLCFLIVTALSGLIFASMWGWFVVPLGYPQISIPHALGLATIVSALRIGSAKEPSQSETTWEALLKPVYALGGAWLFGFVCHLLM
jgi:hypothetical protein